MYGVTRIDTVEDIALVSFKKLPSGIAILSDIFQRFADTNILIDMISQPAPTSQHVDIAFTCFDKDMVQVLEISKKLNEKYPEIRPMVSSGNCKIQLYGTEMRTESGVFARAMKCLADTQVELRQISTSEVDISLLVGSAHLDDAASALKKAFQLS